VFILPVEMNDICVNDYAELQMWLMSCMCNRACVYIVQRWFWRDFMLRRHRDVSAFHFVFVGDVGTCGTVEPVGIQPRWTALSYSRHP